jgi:hypothetical protein
MADRATGLVAGIKKAPIDGAWAKNQLGLSISQTDEKSRTHKRISVREV